VQQATPGSRAGGCERWLDPDGRVGTPEDIGALAVYLLSAQSAFVTGQHFTVDGGMTVKMQYA